MSIRKMRAARMNITQVGNKAGTDKSGKLAS